MKTRKPRTALCAFASLVAVIAALAAPMTATASPQPAAASPALFLGNKCKGKVELVTTCGGIVVLPGVATGVDCIECVPQEGGCDVNVTVKDTNCTPEASYNFDLSTTGCETASVPQTILCCGGGFAFVGLVCSDCNGNF